MHTDNRLIERIYKRLLREASLEGVDTSGLAAIIDDTGRVSTAVVYDISSIEELSGPEYKISSDSIVGFVQIAAPRGAPCRGAWQVKGIAGPGKIVYGLAYAMSPSGLVVPDRSEVSPSASDAWKGYAAKTDPKNILPLDDADHPKRGTDKHHDKYHTEDTNDDCYTAHTEDHLNAAYRGPGGELSLLNKLKSSHLELMNKLSTEGKNVADLEEAIIVAGHAMFDKATNH